MVYKSSTYLLKEFLFFAGSLLVFIRYYLHLKLKKQLTLDFDWFYRVPLKVAGIRFVVFVKTANTTIHDSKIFIKIGNGFVLIIERINRLLENMDIRILRSIIEYIATTRENIGEYAYCAGEKIWPILDEYRPDTYRTDTSGLLLPALSLVVVITVVIIFL